MPVNVIGTLKPKNNGKFPVAEAVDIKVTDDLRLDEALENKADLATVNFALAGKANASDFATSTANLQGQINQIIISSSAESVVAPEVAAARVGADGVTHATLKARCDSDAGSVNQLKADLSQVSKETNTINSILFSNIPIIDKESEIGKINSDGTNSTAYYENRLYLRTKDYIEYNQEKCKAVVDEGYELVIFWYDDNKVYTTKATITNEISPFEFENINLKYIRLMYKKTDGTEASFDWLNHLKVYNLSEESDGFIEETESNINEIKSKLNDYEPEIEKIKSKSSTYTEGTESGYYRVYEGAIEARTAENFTRAKIEVNEFMTSINFTINQIISSTAIYCAFSDENDELIDNYNSIGSNNIEIPKNAKYIYLCWYGDDYNSSYVLDRVRFVTNVEIDESDIKNKYKDFMAVAFGTSLTYRSQTTGGYLQYLPSLSKMVFDNQGVGSSKIYGNADNSILNKILNYNDYSNKNLVVIEGFVNDWYQESPLGSYTDTDNTSVCGCLHTAINHILTANNKINIFVILDHFGINASGYDMSARAIRNNLTQYEYYDEISKVCALYGIPCIKEYEISKMNQCTDKYYIDYIHLNDLGAKQSANVIWSKMKQIYPSS